MSDGKERGRDMAEARDLAMVEQLLAAAHPARAPADEAFLARVLTDALDQQELRLAPAAIAPASPPLFDRLRAALRGGWQVAGGLATAALAGVWLGFAAPGLASGLTGSGQDDLVLPSYQTAVAFLDLDEADTAVFGEAADAGGSGQ